MILVPVAAASYCYSNLGHDLDQASHADGSCHWWGSNKEKILAWLLEKSWRITIFIDHWHRHFFKEQITIVAAFKEIGNEAIFIEKTSSTKT